MKQYIVLRDIGDLEDAIDVTNKIVIPSSISDDERTDYITECCMFLCEYVENNPKLINDYNFEEKMLDELSEHIENTFENIDNDVEFQQDLDEIFDYAVEMFYQIVPRRSCIGNPVTVDATRNSVYKKHIDEKLNIIREKDKTQPPQRTPEWFEKRHNLLSASTFWKSMDSERNKNAIIYEKCCPINPDKFKHVNINSSLHWGQKYEPVSQMYYEYMYDAQVEEFGCIPHTNYSFLGASPDGINVKEDSQRYGRMLEIKNIVNRDITGIPKKEYWVQTQLQMECCDLDECDFLECRFKEYENEEEFRGDGDFNNTSDGKYKGIMVMFQNSDLKPYYEYAPFHCNEEEFDKWYDDIMEKNENKMWVQNIYWRLDEVSCVLIHRNRYWFNSIIKEVEELWNTILYDRVNGYEHRKPGRGQGKKKVINDVTTVIKKEHNGGTDNGVNDNGVNDGKIKQKGPTTIMDLLKINADDDKSKDKKNIKKVKLMNVTKENKSKENNEIKKPSQKLVINLNI